MAQVINRFAKTEKIKVFPATRRANKQVNARLLTEESISSITRRLIDTDGFVITKESENGHLNAKEEFAFDIYGYTFTLERLSDLPFYADIQDPNVKDIYAYILIQHGGSYSELVGNDVQNDMLNQDWLNNNNVWEYRGVSFCLTEPDETTITSETTTLHYIHLLHKNTGGSSEHPEYYWAVPAQTRIKFIYGADVDGGELYFGET